MSTQLEPSLARAILLCVSFRGDDFHRACAGLLLIGLRFSEWDAGMLPAELTTNCKTGGFDPHLAGMATASLRAQGLIHGVGRGPSSSPLANGRKVTIWAIPEAKRGLARTWLERHGYADPAAPAQTLLALA